MRLTKQLQAAGAEVGLDGPATPAARLKTSRLPWSAPRWRWGAAAHLRLPYGAVVPGPLSFDAYCTSDSSREVVTVSGTGLITAVAPARRLWC